MSIKGQVMDTKTLKAMADRFQELADGAEPFDQTVGICHEAAIIAGFAGKDKIVELCSGWTEFSGSERFPVPSCDPRWTAVQAYYNNNIIWSGEYGAARRRLCGFLANEIRKEIGE